MKFKTKSVKKQILGNAFEINNLPVVTFLKIFKEIIKIKIVMINV